MPRETVEPTTNEWGDDTHPAFAVIGASNISTSPPGSILFQSDIAHQHTVVIRVATATRKRDLHHDWVHGGREFLEIEMSQAQWASFVSSMNQGSGVPCTIRRREDDYLVPGVPYEPRLAESLREVHEATDKTFGKIAEALAAYEKALADKVGAKERNAALRNLHFAVEHTHGNLDFAAKSMAETAENVVQRAKADVEAFVADKAAQYGLEPGAVVSPFQITGSVDAPEDGPIYEG
jgi:hypothetical protein